MGMQEHPSTGYVIEADKLQVVFNETKPRALYLKALEDREYDRALNLLIEECRRQGASEPDQIFSLCESDGDVSEDLEMDTPYALFCESEIVETTWTAAAQRLNDLTHEEIERKNWSTFS